METGFKSVDFLLTKTSKEATSFINGYLIQISQPIDFFLQDKDNI